MNLFSNQKTIVFIDGMSLYATSRSLGIDVDYKALLSYFNSRCCLLRTCYYSTVIESEDYNSLRPLMDWLSYNGYTVVSKMIKKPADASALGRSKGLMDVEIAVDMLTLADAVEQIVLFSGDPALRVAIEAVQRKGVRVTVVSSLKTSPPAASDELRKQADDFVELADVIEHFRRPPKQREENRSGLDTILTRSVSG